MYIGFINKKVRKVCETHTVAVKKFGIRNADLLVQRLMEMKSADNLQVLRSIPALKCHPLIGDRKGQYAVDMVQPKRLIFLPTTEEGKIVESLVTEVTVIEIVDYH